MIAALYTLAVFLFFWIVGRMAWVFHMNWRYNAEIYEPWNYAIITGDGVGCDKCMAAACRFLKDYKHGLRTCHPLHWIDTWNRDYYEQ